MQKKRPNVLWIMADQLCADALGCYGNPDCKTPNIDMLSEHGVRMDRAYTTNPVCMPSRLTYLSGMYPHTHGFYNNINTKSPDPQLSLPRWLKQEAQYQTAIVGKAHIGLWDVEAFDKNAIAISSIQPSEYQEYLKKADIKDKDTAWKDDDNVHFMLSQNGLTFEQSQPYWIGQRSIDMIDEFEEPFFLWTSFGKPHPPFSLPPDPPVKYDPASIKLPGGSIEAFKNKPLGTRLGVENIWDIESAGEEKFREGLAAYYTLISMVDHCIGRIIKHLDKKGILENTIICLCADHGDFAGSFGQIGKNCSGGAYESIMRVPLIWYRKGHTGKEVIRGLVDNTDFFPTVCDLVGVETPDWVQGESYARPVEMSGTTGSIPVFEGKDSIFMEYGCISKTVRTRTHKLTYRFDGKTEKGEMYDLEQDPLEEVNLFDAPEHRELRERLFRTLVNHLISTEQPKHWIPGFSTPPWRWFERKFPKQHPESATVLKRVRPH